MAHKFGIYAQLAVRSPTAAVKFFWLFGERLANQSAAVKQSSSTDHFTQTPLKTDGVKEDGRCSDGMKAEWQRNSFAVMKSDCLSSSGHENAALLLELLSDVSRSLLSRCRLFSIPPFPLVSFLFGSVLITRSLHDFCPSIPSWFLSALPSIFPLTRQALYYFISAISKRAVFKSSQKSSSTSAPTWRLQSTPSRN